MSQIAMFLDRDGVLNRTFVREGVPHPPQTVGEVQLLPGVAESLHRLADKGFKLIVVTNQPDVARGTQTREEVDRINAFIGGQLPITAFQVCFHDDADRCDCRKPKPGLITAAAKTYDIDLSRSVLVGDRWSDIAAGQAAGCRTLLIENSYSQAERCTPDFRVRDLPEAAEIILRMTA
jgi:D-glycero-D-manno-heptose 1,7-bisphosphate phosphatase